MLPHDYAQLLFEVLEHKSESQQTKILEKFKAILVKNKHTHLAPAIGKEFEKIQAQKEHEKITYITSASKLEVAQKRELENLFPEPRLFSENPSLLGGIAVRQKDRVYNATLKKKIALLKASI